MKPALRASTMLMSIFVLMTLTLASSVTIAQDDHDHGAPEGHGNHAVATPDPSPSTGIGVVYLTVTNDGDNDDTLLEATTDRAERVEPHVTTIEDDIGRMMPLDGPLVIPAGEAVMLEPAGMHLMLVNLTDDIRLGDSFDLTLTFEEAGEIVVPVTVALGAQDVEEADGDADAEPVTVGDLTIEGVWSRPAPKIDGLAGAPSTSSVQAGVATPEADDEHDH